MKRADPRFSIAVSTPAVGEPDITRGLLRQRLGLNSIAEDAAIHRNVLTSFNDVVGANHNRRWDGEVQSLGRSGTVVNLIARVMPRTSWRRAGCALLSALIRQAKAPNELYKSLTWDRGKGLADHRRFALATNIEVYWCDPQMPVRRRYPNITSVCINLERLFTS